jgi:hypothetical protein
MHLGKWWRELIVEDGHDIPECPDCTDDTGDQWAEGADPVLGSAAFHAFVGEEIETREPLPEVSE